MEQQIFYQREHFILVTVFCKKNTAIDLEK